MPKLFTTLQLRLAGKNRVTSLKNQRVEQLGVYPRFTHTCKFHIVGYIERGHILEISLSHQVLHWRIFICRHALAIFLVANSTEDQSWKSHIANLLMKFAALQDFNNVKNSTIPLKLRKFAWQTKPYRFNSVQVLILPWFNANSFALH